MTSQLERAFDAIHCFSIYLFLIAVEFLSFNRQKERLTIGGEKRSLHSLIKMAEHSF